MNDENQNVNYKRGIFIPAGKANNTPAASPPLAGCPGFAGLGGPQARQAAGGIALARGKKQQSSAYINILIKSYHNNLNIIIKCSYNMK